MNRSAWVLLPRALCAAFVWLVLAPLGARAQTAAAAEGAASPDGASSEAYAEDSVHAWALRNRRYSTLNGSTGGIRLVEPGSGEPGAIRLALTFADAPAFDGLTPQSTVSASGKTLTVDVTALRNLEIYAALGDRGTSYDTPVTNSLSSQYESFGAKAFLDGHDGWHFGGDLRFQLRSEPGAQAPQLSATNVALLGALSYDLRETETAFPLIARFNAEYVFDNSARSVQALEAARYSVLANPLPRADEARHLLTPVERYALGVNRVDFLTFGLGLEAPLRAAERTYLHPMIEWRLRAPIDRQAYDCPRPSTRNAGVVRDQCLAQAGFAALPMDLAFGVRAVPPVRGVTLSLVLDVGLGATSRFAREVAPVAPFALLFGLGYDFDARPAGAASVAAPAAPSATAAAPAAESEASGKVVLLPPSPPAAAPVPAPAPAPAAPAPTAPDTMLMPEPAPLAPSLDAAAPPPADVSPAPTSP